MNRRALAVSILVLAAATLGASSRSTSPLSDEQAIRNIYSQFSAAIKAKDLNKVMSFYTRDEHAVYFDAFPPRQYTGYTAYKKDYEAFFQDFPGPASSSIGDLHIIVSGPYAYTYGIDKWTVTGKDKKEVTMVLRFTEILQKTNGRWRFVHEHLSFPADPLTGMADFMSKP